MAAGWAVGAQHPELFLPVRAVGSNGSRCSSYAGALRWSFASDGRLVVTFGGAR
ncbi:hypothetical protein ABZY30_12500 [Streptomyces massasporeus]|uniref:hypothetical protein n=1 Tax=Streptomyces massasporeus TaxID=67324 RepID=UPI0033AC4C41